MADDCCNSKGAELERLAMQAEQRRVLVAVLVINAAMFVATLGAGIFAGSSALMAVAADMLGDALVYAVSLYAIAKSARWKAGVAAMKGVFILSLGIAVLVNVVVKIQSGVPPSSTIMLVFGALALAGDALCLALLWRFRGQDVNMASTFECSRNDVVENVGVLIAAGLVAATDSPWPDIVIGLAIAAVILRSAVRVLLSAAAELKTQQGPAGSPRPGAEV